MCDQQYVMYGYAYLESPFPVYQSYKTHLIGWPHIWKTMQAHYLKATSVKEYLLWNGNWSPVHP